MTKRFGHYCDHFSIDGIEIEPSAKDRNIILRFDFDDFMSQFQNINDENLITVQIKFSCKRFPEKEIKLLDNWKPELSGTLGKLLTENDDLKDVSFIINGVDIVKGYSLILKVHSTVFKNMLENYDAKDNYDPIPIENTSKFAFDTLLHFINTDCINPISTYEDAECILELAHRFEIIKLKQHAEHFIMEKMNSEIIEGYLQMEENLLVEVILLVKV